MPFTQCLICARTSQGWVLAPLGLAVHSHGTSVTSVLKVKIFLELHHLTVWAPVSNSLHIKHWVWGNGRLHGMMRMGQLSGKSRRVPGSKWCKKRKCFKERSQFWKNVLLKKV